MRTSLLQAVLAVAVVGGIACEGPDNPTLPVTEWTAVLTGANEVPAVSTTAAGTATFSVDDAGTTLTYTINITTLPATSITGAHLHQAAANASTNTVSEDLCGAGTAPACTALAAPGVLVTGTATVTAAQVTSMRAFGMYVNVHTTANTGGEIRGQLRIVPPGE